MTVGVGVDPTASGLPLREPAASGGTQASVMPTGETTRVTVTANDMKFTPNRIEVPAGNRLIIELINEDPTTTHDLVVGDVGCRGYGPTSAELDVGAVGASIEGWCSIADTARWA